MESNKFYKILFAVAIVGAASVVALSVFTFWLYRHASIISVIANSR